MFLFQLVEHERAAQESKRSKIISTPDDASKPVVTFSDASKPVVTFTDMSKRSKAITFSSDTNSIDVPSIVANENCNQFKTNEKLKTHKIAW